MEYQEGSETQFLMTRIFWLRFSLLLAIKEKEIRRCTEFSSRSLKIEMLKQVQHNNIRVRNDIKNSGEQLFSAA